MTNTDLQTSNNCHSSAGTLVILAIALLLLSIFGLWATSIPKITDFFNYLVFGQNSLPIWLQFPSTSIYDLLMPTIIPLLAVLLIVKISPAQQPWSRSLVVLILLVLLGHYLLWRLMASLNLDTPLDSFFSLLLLAVELYFVSRSGFQALLLLKFRDRREEAEKNAIAVALGKFTPSVDILIPTYNEPAQIVQRTVIGCQALEYPYKKIYVLDDTRREEIKHLAQNLGCEYITRPDNRHAKAGNLNHAIAQTSGDLIGMFDVDFIPTRNFLTRTVGFFQDPQIGFLQTSQDFYNPDLIAYNLGLSDVLPHATENYYSHYQLLRDGVDCTACCGSSVVFNRTAIEQIGGFVTTSLCEDYFTGIYLSAQGYKAVYLDEKLSAGLGTENMTGNLSQRLRWGRGTLQGFFIKENPCTIPGLKLSQRVTHLEEGLFNWLGDLPRVCLLLIPFLYTLGITPIQASLPEIIYFLLPYYLVYLTVYTWLHRKTQSFLVADIYTSIHCIPLSLNFIKVLLNPFSEGFQVTPKGISRETSIFHWNLALPLIGLLVINFVSFSGTIYQFSVDQNPLAGIGIIWSTYNLMLIGCILGALRDAPKPSIEWFKLSKPVVIQSLKTNCLDLSGTTTEISEFGIKVKLNQQINHIIKSPNLAPKTPLTVELEDSKIKFSGEISNIEINGESSELLITFKDLSLNQQRYLVETLFCTPFRWQRRESPGDLQILGLLFKNTILRIKNHFGGKLYY